jgi:hypothetical protein
MKDFKVIRVNGVICKSQEAYDRQVSQMKWDGLLLHSRYEGKDMICEGWITEYAMSKIDGSCGC